MFDTASKWNLESASDPQPDIRFQNLESDMGSTSDNSNLQKVNKRAQKRKTISPKKITPDN